MLGGDNHHGKKMKGRRVMERGTAGVRCGVSCRTTWGASDQDSEVIREGAQ